MKRPFVHTLVLLTAALGSSAQQATTATADSAATQSMASEAVSKTADGLAVKGYDVVAYFDQKQAMKGDPAFTAPYKGAIYRFISADHRDLFIKDSEKYLPQYGGFCAYGTSEGHKAPADPEAWTVIDGKLYLNYSKQVQKAFLKEPAGKLQKADANWQTLKQ